MKQERDVLVIACTPMTGASPTTVASVSPATSSFLTQQQPFPTPSPFSFSVASTRWSPRPSIQLPDLFLRFLALVFCFISALSLSLAAPSPNKKSQQPSSFTGYPELVYCFIVDILAFGYSSFQLFKSICDIAHRGILIPDKISDYTTFILDQLMVYLLISSSSVAIPVIQDMDQTLSLWKAAIISTCMSFTTFFVIVTCTLVSGYKLCKRLIW